MAREQHIDEQDAAQSFTMQALAGVAGAKPKTMAPIMEEVATKPDEASQSKSSRTARPQSAKSNTAKTLQKKSRAGRDTSGVKRPGRKLTGRNFPFNQTVTPQTAQAYYDVQAKLDVPMGAVMERAVRALQAELKRKK